MDILVIGLNPGEWTLGQNDAKEVDGQHAAANGEEFVEDDAQWSEIIKS